MKYLVELDHVNSGEPFTAETSRAFIEGTILPTLARAEQLVKEGRILAGGPAAGRIALRFVAEAETNEQLDQLISSIPLWSVADTRVTPLIEFSDRRNHVQMILQRFAGK
jgi:muconolactone delta-isomerase